MSRAAKVVVTCAVAAALLFGAAVVTAAAVLWRQGFAHIEVESEGSPRVALHVPVVLAAVAVRHAPFRIDRKDAAPLAVLLPTAEVLEALPDADLVTVDSGTEHVRVLVRDRRLLVEVDTPKEHVRVALPLAGAASIVRALAAHVDADAELPDLPLHWKPARGHAGGTI